MLKRMTSMIQVMIGLYDIFIFYSSNLYFKLVYRQHNGNKSKLLVSNHIYISLMLVTHQQRFMFRCSIMNDKQYYFMPKNDLNQRRIRQNWTCFFFLLGSHSQTPCVTNICSDQLQLKNITLYSDPKEPFCRKKIKDGLGTTHSEKLGVNLTLWVS